MSKSIEDLIEPDDDTKFSLSLKQLQFIQNDNNMKFMSSIMKTMKNTNLKLKILIISWTNTFKVRQNEQKGTRHENHRNRNKRIKMIVIVKMILKVFYQIEVIQITEQVKKEVVQENGKYYGLK